jgi:hypothetical protein
MADPVVVETITPGANQTDPRGPVARVDLTNPDAATPAIKVEVSGTATSPLPNPLNDYESYTYCLSLHLLGQQEYNNIVNSQGTGYVPQNVLVSSAGRFGTTFKRNSEFAEDFYFDNFKMETYINVSQRSRNSNLIECSFTLIEPLGFTFINRLISAAEQLDTQASYLSMPYLIQIDFFGYQNGEIASTTKEVALQGVNVPGPIDGLRKSIPIRLTGMKTRVTARGTEYAITAVPYNHQAFDQTNIFTPSAMKVKAKTVQEIFGTGNSILAQGFGDSVQQRNDLLAERQRLLAIASSNDSRGGFGIANTQSQLNAINNQLSTMGDIQTSGLTDAINEWWNKLARMGSVSYVNQFFVKFHPSIGSATLYDYTSPTNSTQVVVNTSSSNSTQAAQGASKGQIDFKSGTVSLPGGTKIDAIIDWAVRNSRYISDQINPDSNIPDAQNNIDPASSNYGLLTGPLKWYRIIPKIQIRQFDPKTNKYALDIILEVNPWLVSNKLSYAPLGRKPGEVKLYEWMYSGQNKDVLDMQIDFDMLYYNQLRSYQDRAKTVETAPRTATDIIPDGNPNNSPGEKNPGFSYYKKLTKVPTAFISDDVNYTSRTGGDPHLSIKAGDLQKSLSMSARGDMINLNLKIIGDPHFIKQDDFFYNFNTDTTTSALTPNGSLWMDGSELYIRVIFRSPVDYDDITGLAIPNLSSNKYSYSEFSGIYKLMKVSNEFRAGKFEQTLEMALITIETGISDTSHGSNLLNIQRDTLLQFQPRGFSATRFTGPSIIQTGLFAATGAASSQLAGGQGGSAGGLVNNLINQGVSLATNKLTSALGDKAKDYADQLITKGKELLGIGQSGIDGAVAGHALGGGTLPADIPESTMFNAPMGGDYYNDSMGADYSGETILDGEGVDGSQFALDDSIQLDDIGGDFA